MKTNSITSIAMAILFFASASLMASDPEPSFEILNQEGSTVYKLVYKSPGQGKVSLKISNKGNGIVYSEVLSFTNGFSYPLDFKGMTKGEYIVEISSKESKLKKSLLYEFKNPLAYVHVNKQPNEKYLLTIKSPVPSNFSVRIYDRWNSPVLDRNELVTEDFGLVYNLSQVDGPFTFEVTDNLGKVDILRR